MSQAPPAKNTPGPDMPAFTIRVLTSIAEFHHAEDIQRDIWGITDDTEIVPKDIMLISQKNGGLALGAFNDRDEMIGILYGFPGITDDRHWKHCSHMMGVLSGYRTAGIGEALKNFQREYVLKQGLDLITWTVNPLEGVNASLNFGKLGVVCRAYYPNFYGPMADDLNQGLPSDRFEVEWWIKSTRVEKRLKQETARSRIADFRQDGAENINSTRSEDGLRQPGDTSLGLEAETLLFEIPANFQDIKTASLKTALEWINQSRAVFENYLNKGYLVSEFISEADQGERRNFYVLQRDLTKILDT